MIARIAILIGGMISMQASASETPSSPTLYTTEVVAAYPHDDTAYTQGLFFNKGRLFESTGEYGKSSLREVNLDTGEIIRNKPLDSDIFGEGSVAWENDIVVLSYKKRRGFVFSIDDFSAKKTFRYDGEGWGLTHNGEHLIMSDGTAQIRFLDPETYEEFNRITVTLFGKPVRRINELEWVNGEIFANVYLTNLIMRIDPKTGAVNGVIDLRDLQSKLGDAELRSDEVLNGIAYNADADRLYVTGKHWPKLFEIRLVEARR